MANEQQERPITYSDLLGAQGRVGEQPITKEDAALMQSLEYMAFGRIPKGSAASAMQSAANRNIAAGAVRSDAHGFAAEQGMRITQDPMPGSPTQKQCIGYSEQGVSEKQGPKPSNFTKGGECVEYIAGHPFPATVMVPSAETPSVDVPPGTEHRPVESITSTGAAPVTSDVRSVAPLANNSTCIHKMPDESTDKSNMPINTTPKPVTIGQALEAAGVSAGNSQLDRGDVRAIESAESRASGKNLEKKGLAAIAQSAFETSGRIGSTPTTKVTLSDVLKDAREELPADKIVTDEDATKVREAEKRGRVLRDVKAGGVAECMQAAAERNKEK